MNGWELIKAIRKGEIKENTKIEVREMSVSVTDRLVTTIRYLDRGLKWDEGTFYTGYLCDGNYYFKTIEEQQDIDIQELEELRLISGPVSNFIIDNRNKINELIRAIKQLDKNVNKKHCEVCGVELDQNNTALPNMCWECKYGEER